MANPYHGPDGKFTSKELATAAYNDAIMIAIDSGDFVEVTRLREEQKSMLAGNDSRESNIEDVDSVRFSVDFATTYLSDAEMSKEYRLLNKAATLTSVEDLNSVKGEVKTLAVRNYITNKVRKIQEDAGEEHIEEEVRISPLEGRTAEMVVERLGLPAGTPVQIESVLEYGGRSEDNATVFLVVAGGGHEVRFSSTEYEHGLFYGGHNNYIEENHLSVYGRFQLWLTHKPSVEEFDKLFADSSGSVEDDTFQGSVNTIHPLWQGLRTDGRAVSAHVVGGVVRSPYSPKYVFKYVQFDSVGRVVYERNLTADSDAKVSLMRHLLESLRFPNN